LPRFCFGIKYSRSWRTHPLYESCLQIRLEHFSQLSRPFSRSLRTGSQGFLVFCCDNLIIDFLAHFFFFASALFAQLDWIHLRSFHSEIQFWPNPVAIWFIMCAAPVLQISRLNNDLRFRIPSTIADRVYSPYVMAIKSERERKGNLRISELGSTGGDDRAKIKSMTNQQRSRACGQKLN
jgi:hypothetical protein